MDIDEYTKKALETLETLLQGDNDGIRLEAAREILKYAAATF